MTLISKAVIICYLQRVVISIRDNWLLKLFTLSLVSFYPFTILAKRGKNLVCMPLRVIQESKGDDNLNYSLVKQVLGIKESIVEPPGCISGIQIQCAGKID